MGSMQWTLVAVARQLSEMVDFSSTGLFARETVAGSSTVTHLSMTTVKYVLNWTKVTHHHQLVSMTKVVHISLHLQFSSW